MVGRKAQEERGFDQLQLHQTEHTIAIAQYVDPGISQRASASDGCGGG
jgi:hypothetical protein